MGFGAPPVCCVPGGGGTRHDETEPRALRGGRRPEGCRPFGSSDGICRPLVHGIFHSIPVTTSSSSNLAAQPEAGIDDVIVLFNLLAFEETTVKEASVLGEWL